MSPLKPHVLFVPGSGESIHSRDYQSVLSTIESQGYSVEFVPITWARTTPHKWCEQLMKTYSKYDPEATILAGFSFGAVTALMAAAKRNPAALWLFSLSPYFAENFSSAYMKQSWLLHLGKRRTDEFRGLSFQSLATNIHCPTLLFYGKREFQKFPVMHTQAGLACKHLANNELVIVPNVGHDVADPTYIRAIAVKLKEGTFDE